jgi:probable F420-dependent oxidoreductase
MKIDTMLVGLQDAAENARRLEEIGLDGAFTFEGPQDVFFPLVLAAGATTTLNLMTNVAIAFPRNPIQLAHQANDLQTLSHGKFSLGLGAQIRAQVEKRYGVPFERPVARMRELIGALRAIFGSWQEGSRLDFRGEFYQHTLMPPMFNPGPNPFGVPPILLGALGPQMTRLAAEVADGLLVMPFNTKRYFQERTVPTIAEGLSRAGRSAEGFSVIGEVIVCCGRDEAELAAADEATRWLLSFYASTPSYRPVLDIEGWGDLQSELNAMTKAGQWSELPGRIDDEMLSTLAVRGTPKEVAAAILDRFGGQVDRVGFYTPYVIAPDILGELVDALRGRHLARNVPEHDEPAGDTGVVRGDDTERPEEDPPREDDETRRVPPVVSLPPERDHEALRRDRERQDEAAGVQTVVIADEAIRLGQLLKLANLVDSGGDAKALLESGAVAVNGEVERRRGRQLRDGDLVATGGDVLRVVSDALEV